MNLLSRSRWVGSTSSCLVLLSEERLLQLPSCCVWSCAWILTNTHQNNGKSHNADYEKRKHSKSVSEQPGKCCSDLAAKDKLAQNIMLEGFRALLVSDCSSEIFFFSEKQTPRVSASLALTARTTLCSSVRILEDMMKLFKVKVLERNTVKFV